MPGNVVSQGVSTKMGNLAEELHGRFRIAIFQFTVCGAHAAKRLNPAGIADRRPGAGLLTNFVQRAFPARHETSISNAVLLLVRDDADAHLPSGVNCATVPATAAGVAAAFASGWFLFNGKFALQQFPVFLFADYVPKFQVHNFFRRQANSQRTLRTVNTRIDQRIKLEFDAKLLGETFHFIYFVLIDRRGNGLEF